MISSSQVRAARAMLNWTRVDLAKASKVTSASIGAYERGDTDPRASSLVAIQIAFEQAGIYFTQYGVELPPPEEPPVI